MRFSTAFVLIALGSAAGFVIGVNSTIELVSQAYGWPREEVTSQIDWYIEPVQEHE